MTVQEQPPGGAGFNQLDAVLAGVRAQLTGPAWATLVAELPGPTDTAPIRVAFVGPYNAGKSSLIAALTRDLTIGRSGKPETGEARSYQWRHDVELVDLPGWFSGFTDHDERAGEDLRRNADLVAFVMTVELGDELVVEAIEHVMGSLGFAQRAVVVVNKAQTEDSDDTVVRDEVNRRLGRFEDVPVISTDAQNFLDTISGEFDLDDETITMLTTDSRIDDLAETLDDLVAQQRDTARLQARALQSARVVQEALARLTPDQEEEVAAASLDQLDAALNRAREQLANRAASHLKKLEAAVASIADRVLVDGAMSEAALNQAWDEALAPANQLGDDADHVIAELAASFGGVVTTLCFAADPSDRPRSTSSTSSRPEDPHALTRGLLEAMGIDLTKVSNIISEGASKVALDGSHKGSIAYKAVRTLQPGKRFKPYERLKDAEKLRKGASGFAKVNKAAPVVEEVWKWWRHISEMRAAHQAEAELRSHYAHLARSERLRVETAFVGWTAEAVGPFQQLLIDGRAPLHELAVLRESQRLHLEDLQKTLTSIGAPRADDATGE